MIPGGKRRSQTTSLAMLMFASITVAMLSACAKPAEPVVVTPGTPGAAPAAATTGSAAVAGAAAPNPAASVRYVANTGGVGVRYRVECQDGALYPGGFAEGDEVSVEQGGTGGCAGWSVVTKGFARSWIRDGYLTDAQPAVRGGTPQGGPGAVPPAGGGGAQIPAFAATFQSPVGATITVGELLAGETVVQGGPNGLTYMGIVSNSRIAPDSICNANGPYGSTTGANSVRNPRGQFGMSPSEFSAYDPSAPEPPRMRLKGATVGYLTKSAAIKGNVDPDFLFRALGC